MKKIFMLAVLAATCASAGAAGPGAVSPSLEEIIQTLKGLEANRNNCSSNLSVALNRHKSRAAAGVPFGAKLDSEMKEIGHLYSGVLQKKCRKAGFYDPKDVRQVLEGGKRIPDSEFRDPFIRAK